MSKAEHTQKTDCIRHCLQIKDFTFAVCIMDKIDMEFLTLSSQTILPQFSTQTLHWIQFSRLHAMSIISQELQIEFLSLPLPRSSNAFSPFYLLVISDNTDLDRECH